MHSTRVIAMRLPAAIGLLLLAATSLAACTRGAPLSAESVAKAEQRWRQNALQSYELEVEISGDRVDEGLFLITVEGGDAITISRNGQPVQSNDPFYTIAGLFSFLRDELEMAENPARFWGAPQGTRVYQRVRFDAKRGYPERYIRAVSGTEHNITVVVRKLSAR